MKIKFIILSCLVIASFITSSAYGANGYYIGANIGAAGLNDSDVTDGIDTVEMSFDTGMVFSGVVGFNFSPIRLEVELGYQENDIDQVSGSGVSIDSGGDVNGTVFLVNGYYDFTNTSPFTPYVTAGFGYAKVEINDFVISQSGVAPISDDDSGFAFQLGLGAGYEVNPNFTLDLRWRYFSTEDPKFGDVDAEIGSHQVIFGVRYSF